jgi:hypothetical protein
VTTPQGCPRCGSLHLEQKKVLTFWGWLFLILAIVNACLLLLIPAWYCNRVRSWCERCGWRMS